jgi:4-amino-4-deoxy-L-arabinose transferase-like glycosyltransferase
MGKEMSKDMGKAMGKHMNPGVKFRSLILSTLAFFLVGRAEAHCPLCTVGAGVISGVALMFGISEMSIGVFIGAFAIATGLWVSNMLKLESLKRWGLVSASFALTILPLTSIMQSFYPVYVHLAGDYGSLLNRTYLINLFLVGSVMGAIVVFASPEISWRISTWRKRSIRHQGVIVTILLLILVSAITHFVTLNI